MIFIVCKERTQKIWDFEAGGKSMPKAIYKPSQFQKNM